MSLFDEPAGLPAAPTKPRETRTTRRTNLEDLPAHVKAKLEAAGAADFTSAGPPAVRKAHMISCPGCKKPVMRGLLPMPTPWPVDADPAALTPAGEAMALLVGRRTYNLAHRYDHYELDRRGPWHRHNPVPQPGTDIVADHRCGDPQLFNSTRSTLPPLKTQAAQQLPQIPPF